MIHLRLSATPAWSPWGHNLEVVLRGHEAPWQQSRVHEGLRVQLTHGLTGTTEKATSVPATRWKRSPISSLREGPSPMNN